MLNLGKLSVFTQPSSEEGDLVPRPAMHNLMLVFHTKRNVQSFSFSSLTLLL